METNTALIIGGVVVAAGLGYYFLVYKPKASAALVMPGPSVGPGHPANAGTFQPGGIPAANGPAVPADGSVIHPDQSVSPLVIDPTLHQLVSPPLGVGDRVYQHSAALANPVLGYDPTRPSGAPGGPPWTAADQANYLAIVASTQARFAAQAAAQQKSFAARMAAASAYAPAGFSSPGGAPVTPGWMGPSP